MNSQIAIILILVSSVFGAFSTLYFKKGAAAKISIKNKKLVVAVILAAFSFVFYLYALKQAPLTFIYLTASVSYIWTVLLAKFILKEKFNASKIIGILLIFVGIIVLQL